MQTLPMSDATKPVKSCKGIKGSDGVSELTLKSRLFICRLFSYYSDSVFTQPPSPRLSSPDYILCRFNCQFVLGKISFRLGGERTGVYWERERGLLAEQFGLRPFIQ